MFLHLFHIPELQKVFIAKEMAKQKALIFLHVCEAGMRRRYLSLINKGCWKKRTATVVGSFSKLILKHVNGS